MLTTKLIIRKRQLIPEQHADDNRGFVTTIPKQRIRIPRANALRVVIEGVPRMLKRIEKSEEEWLQLTGRARRPEVDGRPYEIAVEVLGVEEYVHAEDDDEARAFFKGSGGRVFTRIVDRPLIIFEDLSVGVPNSHITSENPEDCNSFEGEFMEALPVGDCGNFYLNMEPAGAELDYPSGGTKTPENVERIEED